MRFVVNKRSYETALGGFTSTPNAHRHLFKHMVPLYEHEEKQGSEHWEEIVPYPPLAPDMNTRVRNTLDILKKIASCSLQENERVERCRSCKDVTTQQQVDHQFEALKHAYLQTGQTCLDWAFSNPTPSGEPRVVAYRAPEGEVLVTCDPRGVHVVASLNHQSGYLEAITIYREWRPTRLTRRRRYETMWLELCRRKAGCRKTETLLDVQT